MDGGDEGAIDGIVSSYMKGEDLAEEREVSAEGGENSGGRHGCVGYVGAGVLIAVFVVSFGLSRVNFGCGCGCRCVAVVGLCV